jgi:hypothetical protein
MAMASKCTLRLQRFKMGATQGMVVYAPFWLFIHDSFKS